MTVPTVDERVPCAWLCTEYLKGTVPLNPLSSLWGPCCDYPRFTEGEMESGRGQVLDQVSHVEGAQPGFQQELGGPRPCSDLLCWHRVRKEGPYPACIPVPPSTWHKDRAQASDRGVPFRWSCVSPWNILALLGPNQASSFFKSCSRSFLIYPFPSYSCSLTL